MFGLVLLIALIVGSNSAHADPILTPLLIGGLVAVGVSASTAAIVAPILASFIIAIGFTLLSIFLAPKPPKPDDGKLPIQQSIPPRGFGYGEFRASGAVILHEEKHGRLYKIHAIVSHLIDSFLAYYLHEDEVEIDGSGYVQEDDDGNYGEDQIQLFFQLGTVPEDNLSRFNTELGSGIWPTTARGDGIAQVGMICDDVKAENFSTIYPRGAPIPGVACRGAKVFDPRITAHSITNSATWEWSDNVALLILHHQCFNEFGPQRDYTTAILPVEDLWIEAADICDELQDLDYTTGSEKRYRCGGWATTENDPKAVLAQMLASCDGWFCERGDGTIILTVGKFPVGYTDDDSVPVLTDEDIIGYYVQRGVPDEEVINHLSIHFNSPLHKYTEVETDPWIDDEDQSLRGVIRESNYDLTWVHSWTQARRIGKREYIRQKTKLRGTLDLRLSGINAAYTRWIRIQSNTIPGLHDTVIENRSCRFNLLAGGLHMEFLEATAELEDWVPAVDEGVEPPLVEDFVSIAPVQDFFGVGGGDVLGTGTNLVGVGFA